MALPNVHISEVPEQGLTLNCAVQPEELALSRDEGRFPEALSLDVSVLPAEQGLSASGVLNGRVIRECVRCLSEFEESLSVPFAAEYKMAAQSKRGRSRASAGRAAASSRPTAGETVDQEDSDLEVYILAGERLDLAEMLREQVILASPMNALCRENCLGLCQSCGRNRNQGRCGCPEPREVSPFAILHELRKVPNSGAAGAAGPTRKLPKASRDE